MIIHLIELSPLVRKQLNKLPVYIVISFQNWVEDVEHRGLAEVRKVSSYHDEPLKGKLKHLRSIRLSRSYRAYYQVLGDSIKFVNVERIDKHEY